MMLRAWHSLRSIRLTVALCFLLAADLALGYLSLRENLEIFEPMSRTGLLEWIDTYGAANPRHAAWFFAMLALLGCLAVNTFVCTTDRVLYILARGHARRELPFRLAPHLMHYAVLVILAGYLCSYLFSTSDTGRALRPGERFSLPGAGVTVAFHGFRAEVFRGDRVDAFDGYVIRPNAQMTIGDGGKEYSAVLNFNEPIRAGGVGIHLNDFQPRRSGGGAGHNYIRLIVRRDPSAVVYRLGMAMFVLGLALYFHGRNFRKKEVA
ncbi:MAG: hypothetical protein LBI87_03090 [Candidatus Accumulibacter sp.]|jgi:cytochrome c biogenesis protein ResB|nr:hypothetical protein [Accumulibacter sp.]